MKHEIMSTRNLKLENALKNETTKHTVGGDNDEKLAGRKYYGPPIILPPMYQTAGFKQFKNLSYDRFPK